MLKLQAAFKNRFYIDSCRYPRTSYCIIPMTDMAAGMPVQAEWYITPTNKNQKIKYLESNPCQNIIVIIRSAHERTEELCRKLITEQGLPENQLFVVHEVPFSAAMKASFEIGLRENRRWTYCIDADVLLRPGAIQTMMKLAEKEKSAVCEVQGFVMDKFFGGPRQAGNHLYRTSLLKKVIDCIPKEGVDIRPERYTLRKMAEMGYPWKPVPYIVGLHDNEQSYFDIYRKAYIHGVKHLDRAQLLISHWRNYVGRDRDYLVALKAFSDSISGTEEAFIDRRQELYRTNYEAVDIEEKGKLDPQSISPQSVEETISSWNYPGMYYYYFPTRDGLDSRITGFVNKVKRNYGKLGLRNFVKAGFRKII